MNGDKLGPQNYVFAMEIADYQPPVAQSLTSSYTDAGAWCGCLGKSMHNCRIWSGTCEVLVERSLNLLNARHKYCHSDGHLWPNWTHNLKPGHSRDQLTKQARNIVHGAING